MKHTKKKTIEYMFKTRHKQQAADTSHNLLAYFISLSNILWAISHTLGKEHIIVAAHVHDKKSDTT